MFVFNVLSFLLIFSHVHFTFQMNLQLIFWIGLIGSICCVFGQTGKKKNKKKFSGCLFISVSCITFESIRFHHAAPSESPAVAASHAGRWAGFSQGPAQALLHPAPLAAATQKVVRPVG